MFQLDARTQQRILSNLLKPARFEEEMALYFSAHTIACLTKQALRELMNNLMASTDLQVRRCVASQLAGRMLTEVEAPDQATLEKWFERHHVNVEWMMRLDLDGQDGVIKEY
jgi:hypothetical protein